MNILLLNYEYPPLGGGGGFGSQKIAQELSRQFKDKIIILTAGTTNRVESEVDPFNVQIVRLPILSKRHHRSSASMLFMLMYVLKSILYIFKNRTFLKSNTDIIFTSFAIPTGPVGWFASKILNKPNVLQLIGGEILKQPLELEGYKNPIVNFVVRWMINSADRVIAISNDTANQAKLMLGISKEISVLTLGYAPPEDADLPISDGKKKSDSDQIIRFIMVSRLVERKGLKYLIDAFSKVSSKKSELHLAGDGPETETLKRQCQDLNISDRVFFHGFVSERKKFELLLSSDVFVLPTLHEGLGLVYYEAMYAGLPIITTNNGGQTDFLSNENAMLIDIMNVDQLIKAMNEAMNNKHWRITCGLKNKESIKDLFVSKIISDYQKMFQDMMH